MKIFFGLLFVLLTGNFSVAALPASAQSAAANINTSTSSPTKPASTAPVAPPANNPPAPLTLKIGKTGNGGGVVTGIGINCGADCEQEYTSGTVITLNAVGDATSKFIGWTGDCLSTGTHTCQTTMDKSKTVAAGFTKVKLYTLTLTKGGTGDGMVSSTVMPGIKCGDVCSLSYKEGAVVFLNAEENATSEFKGWSGGSCLAIGSHTCKLTVTNNMAVTATFDAAQMYTLAIEKTGNGSGTVVGDGIDCGSKCKESFKKGTVVTLHATADQVSKFDHFAGDCVGIGAGICRTTMDSDKTITFFFKGLTQMTYLVVGGIAVVAGLLLAWRRRVSRHKHIGGVK